MKQTVIAIALTNEDEEWDRQNAIDVFYPTFDAVPGETPVIFNLRYAFNCAGYWVTHVEEVRTHPVLVVHALRRDAEPINDQKVLFQHIRALLRGAGFRLQRDELTFAQRGDRILIAFQSGKPRQSIEEILREPQDDMMNYADADMRP